MLIGAVLAVIVLLLFLRHARVTAISASSIPITMAITVFVMSLVGQTFNLMTLGAMAIAIGIVIDDAVVITENIVRHAHLQPNRQLAIRDAVQELIWPVTTSTITTVVVFLPARIAHRRRRPVLPRALDHADDRRARVARRRADDHSAAQRAVSHRRAIRFEAPSRGAVAEPARMARPRHRFSGRPVRAGARRVAAARAVDHSRWRASS